MSTALLETAAQLLTFADGMPGFPGLQRFSLVPLDGLEPFMALEPTEGEGPSFVVVPPSAVLEDYTVTVDDDTAAALDLEDADDAFVLGIVAIGAEGGHTVNLLGPLVVNRHTGKARQVVLVDSGYDLRHPLG